MKKIIELSTECGSNPKLRSLTQELLEETLQLKAICFEAIRENAHLEGKVQGLKALNAYP